MNIVAFHVIQIPLLKTSSTFDRHFTETVSLRGEIISNTKPKSQQHRPVASLCTLTKSFPLQCRFLLGKTHQKNSQLTTQEGGETLGNVELIYPFPIITGGLYRAQIFPKNRFSFNYLNEFTLPEAVTQTYMWRPEAGTFSYCESSTLPLEGTSLH